MPRPKTQEQPTESGAEDRDKIKFFGKIDYNKHGNLASSVPAWSMTNELDELREGIDEKKRALEAGRIPPDAKPQTMADIEREEKRLEAILTSRPVLNDKQRDELYKAHKSIGRLITETMFTTSEMQKGLASGHEEHRRNTQPVIEVRDEVFAHCIEESGGKIVKGRVSRNDAVRAWKNIGRVLGEPTHSEYLRKAK